SLIVGARCQVLGAACGVPSAVAVNRTDVDQAQRFHSAEHEHLGTEHLNSPDKAATEHVFCILPPLSCILKRWEIREKAWSTRKHGSRNKWRSAKRIAAAARMARRPPSIQSGCGKSNR